MTLKQAKEIRATEGGDYPDLKSIAEQGDVLAVFRLIDFLPATPGAKNPKLTTYPVRADLLICSGPDEGRVWFAQTFIGNAVSPTLRGAKDGEPPTNSKGDEIGTVIRQPTRDFPIVNAPSADQFAQIEATYRGFPERDQVEPAQSGGASSSASSSATRKPVPWQRRTS